MMTWEEGRGADGYSPSISGPCSEINKHRILKVPSPIGMDGSECWGDTTSKRSSKVSKQSHQ